MTSVFAIQTTTIVIGSCVNRCVAQDGMRPLHSGIVLALCCPGLLPWVRRLGIDLALGCPGYADLARQRWLVYVQVNMALVYGMIPISLVLPVRTLGCLTFCQELKCAIVWRGKRGMGDLGRSHTQ